MNALSLAPSGQARRAMLQGALAFAGLSIAAPVLADVIPADLDLQAFRGKVVFIDFWASWCGPCKLSFPYLRRIAQFNKNKPFALVSVNVDHAHTDALVFLQENGPDVEVIFDPKGVLAARFNVKAMPTSILIGKDGRIRYVHQGFFPDKTPLYNAHISELLNEN